MHRILILAAAVICTAVHARAADEQPERKTDVVLPELSSERSNPKVERQPAPGQAANLHPLAAISGWGGGQSMAEWYIERTDKIVNLSDEQKQKIRAEYESRDKATREFHASMSTSKARSRTASMTEAFQSQDKEAIAKAQKEYQELFGPMLEITKKSEAAVQAVLTSEQRIKLFDNQIATMITAYTPGVEVSDAQRQEIKAGLGPFAGDNETFGRKLPELIDKTLTADQIAAILKHRATATVSMMFATAKLSSDQLKKIDEKFADLTRDHKKTANLDYTIYQQLSQYVNGLLSAEQKEAMNAQRAWVGFGSAGGGLVTRALGGAAPGSNPDPNQTAERKPAETKGVEAPANFQVTQIPGGGIQVIIREGGEAKEEGAPQQRLQVLQRQLLDVARQAPLNNRASLRERVKRQHELTKKASKLMKKIDELGEGNREKAHELWEDLERVEGQLRQTFAPAHSSSMMPAQPAAGWVQHSSTPAPGAPLNPAPRGGFQAGGAALNVPGGATQPDVRSELQSLRRQIEELRAQVQKLNERK